MKICRALALALLIATAHAHAQPAFQWTPIQPPVFAGEIDLDTGASKKDVPESWFIDNGARVVRNVSHATLIPYFPAHLTKGMSAVIIAPGGAFAQLSIDTEGTRIAQWFNDHGIVAFVLKYRLRPTAATLSGYQDQVKQSFAAAMAGTLDLTTPPTALADMKASLAIVRKRAEASNIDPAKVGVVGFSAGAITLLSALQTLPRDEMPSFVASIYGPVSPIEVPAGAPPLFVALAADDMLFGKQGYGIVQSWQRAGRPAELHVFQSGGHGFGAGVAGTTTTAWPALLYDWLKMNKLAK